MKNFSRFSILLLAFFALSSCRTVNIGRDFDVTAFEMKIERGVTTQTQVSAWLGQPVSTGVEVDANGERFDEWTYYFATGRLAHMSDAKFKMLQVNFGKDGVVRSYKWSDSAK